MKLDQFVKETLIEITNGVAAAQDETLLFIAPGIVEGEKVTEAQRVDFEVAVTVSSDGDGGISVLGIGELKGGVSKESTNRISFGVPMHFNAPTRANPRHFANLGPLNPVSEDEIK